MRPMHPFLEIQAPVGMGRVRVMALASEFGGRNKSVAAGGGKNQKLTPKESC